MFDASLSDLQRKCVEEFRKQAAQPGVGQRVCIDIEVYCECSVGRFAKRESKELSGSAMEIS